MWRHHAVFTDSPLPMPAAEPDHGRHAIIEQVIADLNSGPPAHLPTGNFAANSAWLTLAAISFNLTRALGALASGDHAAATTATLRTHLVAVPARITRTARVATLRALPDGPGPRRSGATRTSRTKQPRPQHQHQTSRSTTRLKINHRQIAVDLD